MTLCCKIHHHIRVLFLKQPIYRLPVRNALFHKAEIRIFHHRSESREIPGVSQAVQTYDPVIRILCEHMKNKVTSDKTGTAGHDNRHHNFLPFLNIMQIPGSKGRAFHVCMKSMTLGPAKHEKVARTGRISECFQGAECQWHSFSTDRSEAEMWEHIVRNNPWYHGAKKLLPQHHYALCGIS